MIYLDNAATTEPSKAAVDAMIKAAECFGNPSSLHGLGIEAEKLINESKKNIADMLGVESKNILFTSGGTRQIIWLFSALRGTSQNRYKNCYEQNRTSLCT